MKTSDPLNNILTRRIWPHRVLLILIIGLFFYVLSYLINDYIGPENFLPRFFKEFGIALIIAMIIAFTLERLIHETLLKEVHEALEMIRKGADVLEGATELGIEDIFARHDPSGRKRWESRVKKAIENQLAKGSGEILISCVAVPEFFRQDTEIGATLWQGFTSKETKCILKVLLLCPLSPWTKRRIDCEPGHPTLSDIHAAAQFLLLLKKKAGDKVRFNCYDFPPTAFLIITDECIFIESYPMLKVAEGEGPIGGKTPMVVVRKDTNTYKRWAGHFEYIWTQCSKDYETAHLKD